MPKRVVATMGPAVADLRMLKSILPKVGISRMNMSHGTHYDHANMIKNIRSIDSETKILIDLQGPKIRVGNFPGGPVDFKAGDKTQILYNPEKIKECDHDHLYVSIPELTRDVQVGDILLFNDGYLSAKVIDQATETNLFIEFLNDGTLSDKKGINSSTASLSVDPLTDKDLIDLDFAVEQNADIIALSFARNQEDILHLRALMDEKKSTAQICVKVERHEAMENLEAIIEASDVVMVARGDLGVEIEQTDLPAAQLEIIRVSQKHNKPIIWATQVLESMIDHPRPTRAELTDVHTAITHGCDYTMLSAESSIGKYPEAAIELMDTMWAKYQK